MNRNWKMTVPGGVVLFFCYVVGATRLQSMEQNATLTGGYPVAGVHRSKGFHRKLIVTTVLEQPYMMLKPHSPYLAGNDRFEGYLADILLKLATSAGFQYEIRLVRDGRYGDLNSNGQWDGMIGEVLAGEADIAAGAIVVTDGKRDFVDFTESFLTLRSSALIRKPKSKRRQQRIVTAEQLLSSDMSFGVVDNSAAYRLLAESNDPLKRSMWNRILKFRPSVIVGSVQEGMDRARRENYAFILDSPMAEFVATRRPCDLYSSDPFLDMMTYAFAMRRDDSYLRGVIDKELQKIKQSDEMQTMYLRWWRDECDDTSVKEDETQELKRNTGEVKISAALNNSASSRLSCVNIYLIVVFLFAKSLVTVFRTRD